MEDLHLSFGGAHFDHEIGTLQADMIRAIVSFKLGVALTYEDLTVINLSAERWTVKVNASRQIIEFRPP